MRAVKFMGVLAVFAAGALLCQVRFNPDRDRPEPPAVKEVVVMGPSGMVAETLPAKSVRVHEDRTVTVYVLRP